MKHNAASRFHGTLGAVAVSHSLFFVLVETWMAVRGEFSVTVANDTLQATLTALFVYGAAAFLAGECLAVAYGMVRRDAPKDSMVALPAGTAASLAVWTLIMVYASDRPLTVFATGYAALAGSGVLGWALARRQPAAAKQLMCILGTACLYGIAALNLGDRAFFARSARADWAMALCLGWALGIGLGGALLWLFVARAGLRRVLAAVGLAAAAAPLALGYLVVHGLLPRGEPNQPSLLVVSADTLRADYCSAYGGPVPTPALEALAAQGVFFERFYALAPWTMPSLNAMFSSRYPPGFLPDSDLDLGDPLRYAAIGSYWCGDGDATFPERAARHGLVCGAVVANPLMDQPWLMDGFREAAVFNPHGAESVGPFSRLPLLRGVAAWFAPSLVPRQPYDLTRLTLEYALQFLERYHSQPFFLWVHFLDPHAPYEPPQRFTDESDRESVHDLMIRLQKYAAGMGTALDSEEQRRVRALYEGEIRYVDEAVGRILDRVQALGIDDRAYRVFTADHGEEFWDHGKWKHGQSLYDELLRVPLIMAGPGLAPRTIDQPVSAIDAIPTFADLIRAEPSPAWRGVSFAPVLLDNAESIPERPCFSQATLDSFRFGPLCTEASQSVIRGPFKLVRGLDTGRMELYDVLRDPAEKADLSPDHATLVDELNGQLDEWSTSFPSTFSVLDEAGMQTEVPEDMVETFRAMGYLR